MPCENCLWLSFTHIHKRTLRDVTDGRPSSDLCIYCMSPRKIRHTHTKVFRTLSYPFAAVITIWRGVFVCLCVCTCVFTDENSALLKGHKKLPLLPHWDPRVLAWFCPLTQFWSVLTMVGGLQESTAELESNQKKSVRGLSLTLQQPSVMGLKLCCLSFIINSWKNGEKKCYLEIQPDRQHTSHRS